MGTHNSMMPKYQPSMMDPDEQNSNNDPPKNIKEKNILQMKSMMEKKSPDQMELLNKSVSMVP
jgi:hypothetical protein